MEKYFGITLKQAIDILKRASLYAVLAGTAVFTCIVIVMAITYWSFTEVRATDWGFARLMGSLGTLFVFIVNAISLYKKATTKGQK